MEARYDDVKNLNNTVDLSNPQGSGMLVPRNG